jgi:hypothetical protein
MRDAAAERVASACHAMGNVTSQNRELTSASVGTL